MDFRGDAVLVEEWGEYGDDFFRGGCPPLRRNGKSVGVAREGVDNEEDV